MAARTVVESFLAALSAADVAATLQTLAPEFRNEVAPAIGSSTDGRDEYGVRLPGFLEQFAALQYEIVDIVAEGGQVAVRYRLTANFRGHPIDLPGVMWFEVVDDLITHRIDVWDSLTLLRQTGTVDER